MCGGNGIILDNHVMKCLLDVEAMHTYEGSYEINSLVSGRELTGGLSAIRWKYLKTAFLIVKFMKN